jgi:hypothetical protein
MALKTKKEIFDSVESLEHLTGIPCNTVRSIEKPYTLEELNIAWEEDSNWFNEVANAIKTFL